MLDKISTLFQKIWDLLPGDPFREYIEEAAAFMEGQEWIGVLNYFIPVGTFCKMGMAWLACVAAYIVVTKVRDALFGNS